MPARSEYLNERDLTLMYEIPRQPANILNTMGLADSEASLDEIEKATILRILESTAGNKSQAARRLGITRKTFRKKLKTYGVMP